MSTAFCGKKKGLISYSPSYSLCFSVPLTSVASLPQQLHGNLARLRSCVEELRSIPGDGCIRGAARAGELLQQAVLDSLQQFKQYIRHSSTTKQTRNNNMYLEVGKDLLSEQVKNFYFKLHGEMCPFDSHSTV